MKGYNRRKIVLAIVTPLLMGILFVGNTEKVYAEQTFQQSDGKTVTIWTPADETAFLQHIINQAPGYTYVTNDADFYAPAAPAQSSVPTTPATPKKVKGSYVLLATGTVVKPGGSIPLSQLATAVFVNGTDQNVMYTAIATNGAYSYKTDPEPNWAYVGSVAPGGTIPLSSYAAWMMDPYNTHLTIELRGTKDYEYSFVVNKAQ